MMPALLEQFHADIWAIDEWAHREGAISYPFPRERFRSRELTPLDISPYPDILHMPWEQLHALVNHVRIQRRTLLVQQGLNIHADGKSLPMGRLLAFDPHGSLSDGAANVATDGFFDDDNVPPWDLWLTSIELEVGASNDVWRPFRAYVICWIPMEVVGVAQLGIDVNPEECILWLKDIPQYT